VELTAIIEMLRKELEAERAGKPAVPSFVKPNTHKEKGKQPKKTRRQRSAEQNAGRKSEPASQVTETRQHALDHCPTCDYKLNGQSVARKRQVIDLPEMPALRVVEHQVIKRWCPKCQKWHVPELDLGNEVIGQGRIGLGIASMVSWLRTELRLPVRQVRHFLQKVYKLDLSVGEIVELTHKVAQAGQVAVTAIKQAIFASPHVHMDETSWRENGDNGFVWASSTPAGLRAYEFHFSRASEIPETLLQGFEGTLVTDFYAAYNHTDGRHQRCWVHLLRDLRDLKKDHGGSHPEVLEWTDSVVQTYRDGLALAQHEPPLAQSERQTGFNALLERIEKLGLLWPREKTHPAHALCKRLLRHSSELFEFVLQPGLAADNNLAERSVRPLVIARKISGGTRSDKGSDTRMSLQTLFATWAAQGKSALDECRAMLLGSGQPGSLPQV
jgi:transposase